VTVRLLSLLAPFAALGLAAVSCTPSAPPPPAPAGQSRAATVYIGARLLTGASETPLEDAAFVVADGRVSAVGTRSTVTIPEDATQVDLSGKTVMPALVDGHSHIGYVKGLTSSPANYTRENIIDHMRRFAYYGVAASQAMGSDFGVLPYLLRDQLAAGIDPDAARFLTAGRGLAPPSEISPSNMRHAAFVVTTEDGARADVVELSSRGVRIVKTWVDDRGGANTQKLAPNLYRAIIDEAHQRGMRVAVHATGLADAKDLLRAGIDIFAHMIGEVDDELEGLFKQHPGTVVLPTLPAPRLAVYAPQLVAPPALLTDTISAPQIARARAQRAALTPEAAKRAQESWDKLARGVARLHAAGVKLGLGTDGGGQNGGFIGWTAHAELENVVAAGLSPAQAITIATRNTAQILGLDDLGLIAIGKSADFIVLDANPLDDITNTRRIADVYLRGHRVDRARLRADFMETRE
jgi:imidazolonepropionase-like amidohydrolase